MKMGRAERIRSHKRASIPFFLILGWAMKWVIVGLVVIVAIVGFWFLPPNQATDKENTIVIDLSTIQAFLRVEVNGEPLYDGPDPLTRNLYYAMLSLLGVPATVTCADGTQTTLVGKYARNPYQGPRIYISSSPAPSNIYGATILPTDVLSVPVSVKTYTDNGTVLTLVVSGALTLSSPYNVSSIYITAVNFGCEAIFAITPLPSPITLNTNDTISVEWRLDIPYTQGNIEYWAWAQLARIIVLGDIRVYNTITALTIGDVSCEPAGFTLYGFDGNWMYLFRGIYDSGTSSTVPRSAGVGYEYMAERYVSIYSTVFNTADYNQTSTLAVGAEHCSGGVLTRIYGVITVKGVWGLEANRSYYVGVSIRW